MNGRELFEAIYSGKHPDRLPLRGIGRWAETLERWHSEGLAPKADPNEVLGLVSDDVLSLPLNLNMVPPFTVQVLDLGANYVTLVDEYGVTKRMLRADYDRSQGLKGNAGMTSSMALWLDFPVRDLRTWKAIYEQRFQPTLAGRLPVDWEEQRAGFVQRSQTRWVAHFCFPFGGLFSALRELIGWPGLAYALADDPKLVHTMVADLAEFYINAFAQVLPDVCLDQITFFEDMCATKAPLIGPATFREFIAPGYRKLVGELRALGVRHFFVDSDGNVTPLVPELLACGITGLVPCEVNAGMDVAKLRSAFPMLCLNGGIDKRALADGPRAIKAELERCFTVAWNQGRYTPALDHSAPPDISWANVQYYARRFCHWCVAPQGR